MAQQLTDTLARLLADTYALYLKTQNYHWHVTGPNFKPIHELFEVQYTELALAVDAIAERIRTLGEKAPASFAEFDRLKAIKDGDSSLSGEKMLQELVADNKTVVKQLYVCMKQAQEANDEGSIALISERIGVHEKAAWMLTSSI